MRENYINEMSQVHAPKELIEKTKLAMREQMEKENINAEDNLTPVGSGEQKKRTWMRYVPLVATVAAAVLIVMLVPGLGRQQEMSEFLDSAQSELIQSELMLEQIDMTPGKIIPGTSELNNIETFIVNHYPEEFLSDIASEKEVEGIPVRFVKDEKTGFYKAVFSWKTDKILVISEMIEMERIVEAVEEVIQTLAAQTED